MEDFEISFVKELPSDSDTYSIILDDKRYNGWFRYTIDSEEFTDIIVRFRLPTTMPLYGDVARHFLPEERLVGIHRMLIGKDLQEETRDILNYSNVNDYVATLDDAKIKELLDRMKSMVTIDCNAIPYLHIRLRKSFGQKEKDFYQTIKDYIASHPSYLNIFYDVLNEKITVKEATDKSNGMIFSEYLQLTK